MDSYLVCHSEEVMASLTVPLSPVPLAPLYRGATGTVLPKKRKKNKSPNPVEGKLATAWIFQRETGGKERPSLSVAATVRDACPACTETWAYVDFCFWRVRPWLIRTKLCLSWQEPMESGERGTEAHCKVQLAGDGRPYYGICFHNCSVFTCYLKFLFTSNL